MPEEPEEEEELLPSDDADLEGRQFAEYYAACVTLANEELHGSNQADWLRWLELNREKINAALDWCLTEPDAAELGLELAAVIWHFWFRSGYIAEGREKLLMALQYAPLQEPTWARASVTLGIGRLSLQLGKHDEVQHYYTQSLQLGRHLQDKGLIAEALIGIGESAFNAGHFQQSLRHFEECLPLFTEVDDHRGICKSFKALGIVHYRLKNYSDAIGYLSKGLEVAQSIGSEQIVADCYLELGNVALHQEERDLASGYYEKSLTIVRRLRDKAREASLLVNLSILAERREEHKANRQYAQEAAGIYHELGMPRHEAYALINVGTSAIAEGDYDFAYQSLKQSLVLLCSLLEPDHYAAGQAIEDMALLFFKQGRYEEAVTLHGTAASLRRSTGANVPDDSVMDYSLRFADLRRALGDDLFEELWAIGSAKALEEAFSYIVMVYESQGQ